MTEPNDPTVSSPSDLPFLEEAETTPPPPQSSPDSISLESMIGHGGGYQLQPPAISVTFEPGKDTDIVLVTDDQSWRQIVELVPFHLRGSTEAQFLFDQYAQGGPRQVGFLSNMVADFEEEAEEENDAKKRRKAEQAKAYVQQLDGVLGALSATAGFGPRRQARIPAEKLPPLILLVAAFKTDWVGLTVLAAWLGIDPRQSASLLDLPVPTKPHLVVALRLFAGPAPRPWIEFELAKNWYPAIAEIKVMSVHLLADSLEVLINFRFRVGPKSVVRMHPLPPSSTVRSLREVLAAANLRPSLNGDPAAVLTHFSDWRQENMFTAVDIIADFFTLSVTPDGPTIQEYPALSGEDAVGVIDEPFVAWTSMAEGDDGLGRATPDSRVVPLTQLPVTRVFNLRRKEWVYADYRAMQPHAWHGDLLDRLVLPDDYRETIHRVARTLSGTNTLTPDIFPGRHGGVIILAEGPTGTGKTATAEALADAARRPVYEVSAWDLLDRPRGPFIPVGPHDDGGLEPIARVFDRAARWRAVLLIDEADVLFSHRESSALDRSALVGRFLHLAETFTGVLILTTNLPGSLDTAIVSRCSLVIPYEAHDAAARATIWRAFFAQPGLSYAEAFVDHLSRIESNGRQIRSAVRMATLGNPSPSQTDFERALQHTMPKWKSTLPDPSRLA